jgi:hypothetical protein
MLREPVFRAALAAAIAVWAAAPHVASAQAPGPGDAPANAARSDEPPVEFSDPDGLLEEYETLIGEKRMDDLFVALIRSANLTHPVKNIDPDALRRIGHNLLGLFHESEIIHYVDRVRDETFGSSLRRAVILVYTSRDRWIYFTLVLKRGAAGWQVTKFDYAVDRFDLFPAPKTE